MRLIGLAERVLERMCRRADLRRPFGRALSEQSVTLERIAHSRIMIEQARLLTLKSAWMMDTVDNKQARAEIAMIKVAAPKMACQVIDWAMQVFGGAGINNDYFLGASFATARLLRIADGPDEVHCNQIGRMELQKHRAIDPGSTGSDASVLSVDAVERLDRHALGRVPAKTKQ
jgi:acyl-CoA dehydrogenase